MKFVISLFKHSPFNIFISTLLAWAIFSLKIHSIRQLGDLYELASSVITQNTFILVALMGLLGAAGVYLSHHTLRNQSLKFKMDALGSKTHKDQLTKVSASLHKDASLLIQSTRNFIRALKAAGTGLIALPVLGLWLGTDPLSTHWSFAVLGGLTGFAIAMLIVAVMQLGATVESRAKTA